MITRMMGSAFLSAALLAGTILGPSANAAPALQGLAGQNQSFALEIKDKDKKGKGGGGYPSGGHLGHHGNHHGMGGAALGLGIAGAIIGGAIIANEAARAERANAGYERCAATYRSFNPRTGTYIGHDNIERPCPYL
jgi:hypothetical protein